MVDAQAVRTWLKEKGIRGCGACGGSDLKVSKDLYALVCINRATGGPDMRHGSRAVRLRCAHCGHLMLFHARQMGLE